VGGRVKGKPVGSFRGYAIEDRDGEHFFSDTGKPTVSTWASRPCGRCGRLLTADGHDGCLGTLPGVMNACCGHGHDEGAYVQFESGRRLAGEDAIRAIQEIKEKISESSCSHGDDS